jgi:hypothetical protein
MDQIAKDELRKKKIVFKPMKNTIVTTPSQDKPKKCDLCNVTFPSRTQYNMHQPACVLRFDIVQNPKQHMNHILSIKDENIPSTIDYLLQTVVTMKQRIEELEHMVYKQKKKVSILEWLNTNVSPSVTFQHWFHSINIHLELATLVFENGFQHGITSVLKQLLPIDNENVVPMRSYNEQKNTIYVYVENKDTHGRYWTKMTDMQFELMIQHIGKQLIQQLFIWKKKREGELNSPIEDVDDQYKIYATYKSRILGDGKDKTELFHTIKRNLYEYLKMRLSGAIEYEFTWS